MQHTCQLCHGTLCVLLPGSRKEMLSVFCEFISMLSPRFPGSIHVIYHFVHVIVILKSMLDAPVGCLCCSMHLVARGRNLHVFLPAPSIFFSSPPSSPPPVQSGEQFLIPEFSPRPFLHLSNPSAAGCFGQARLVCHSQCSFLPTFPMTPANSYLPCICSDLSERSFLTLISLPPLKIYQGPLLAFKGKASCLV